MAGKDTAETQHSDKASITTTSTDQTLVPKLESSSRSTSPSASKESKSSWRAKLQRSKPEEPGKEKWRDASLSEKERWKEWNKAKDKEQQKNSTAGFFTEQYKGKGKFGYWLDAFV